MPPEISETLQKGIESPYQGETGLYGHPRSFTAPSPELKYTNTLKPTTNTTEPESDVAVPNECCVRSAWLENYYFWATVYPNLLKAQSQAQAQAQAQPHPVDGWVYPSSHGGYYTCSRYFPQLPVQMVVPPQSYHPEYNNFQEFQYFVVIDFEATCDKERNPHPQEIIEFPSVLVNGRTGQLEDFFQVYVRPTHNQHLTDFCKDLTGIQQSQVDKGVLLGEALLMHDKWLEEKGVKHSNFAVVTWSNWDCRVMLESECRFKRIRKPPYFNRWINLKIPYNEVFGDSRCNLREAVERAGVTWEGRAHCGLDDAKNTARLLTQLMTRGSKLSITNNLLWQSSDRCPTSIPVYPAYKNPSYLTTVIPQPMMKEPPYIYCYCGAASVKRVEKGGFFFGCGNCTAKGPGCSFFKWASVVNIAEPVKAG